MALLERTKELTVASALTTRATLDPQGVFLRSAAGDITFGEVDSSSDAMAAALSGLGMEAGDRVAIILPPCPEFVVSLFALAKLGAVAVPLDPGLRSMEIQYMLRHSETVCAVTAERAGDVDYLELFEELAPTLPELQYLVTAGEEDLWYDDRVFQFEDLLSAGMGRDYAPIDREGAESCFALVYTAGTTGKPKGVELSHRSLVAVASGTAEALELSADDRIVGVSALFHVWGLGPGLLSSVLSGASLVLQPEPDAATTVSLAEAHRATVHHGVPTLFIEVLEEQERRARDLSALRLAVLAGAPVEESLLRRVESSLCPTAVAAYSITEAGSTVSLARPSDPPTVRYQTVGRPIPETEVRIVGEDGADLPVESVGEILVRGPGVMLGYHRQPGETRRVLDEEGFLHTGDLGLVDEEGHLHLVGRRKEVIIRSGFNVYPREVESRVSAHPAVHEVAVIGVPDPRLGEAICACVVPEEGAIVTEDEIVRWCREVLAAHKIPDAVRFVDAFPRTGTGKIRRVELARAVESSSHPA